MDVKIKLNGKLITDSVDQDMVLLDFCRKHNCFSVKRGCESGNCGLCTVLLDGKPVLSCSTPIGRADGRAVDTLEGLEEEAKQFTGFFAAQGADQCGFCNPGYIVNIVALLREILTRLTRKFLNIFQEICAVVQDIRVSCAQSEIS